MMKTRTKTYERWNYKIILAFITMMLCLVFAKNNVFAVDGIDYDALIPMQIDGTKTAVTQFTKDNYMYYYTFTIPTAGMVKLSVINYGECGQSCYSYDVKWELCNEDEKCLYDGSVGEGTKSTPHVYNMNCYLKQGKYYIITRRKNDDVPSYQLAVTFKSLNCSVGDNDSILKATPTNLNSYVFNTTTKDSTIAWYSYNITQAGDYYLDGFKTGYNIDGSSGHLDLCVYDSVRKEIGSYYWGNTDIRETVTLPAGTVYIKVQGAFTTASYGPYKFMLSPVQKKGVVSTNRKKSNTSTSSNANSLPAPSVVINQTKQVVKYTKLVKKKMVVYINTVIDVANARVSYKLQSCPKKGKKYVKISKKGKVTFKKKAPKGVYKVKVTVKKTASTRSVSRIVKIRVK